MFSITFEYDNDAGKWEVYATGALSERDAVQGFNAVLLTSREAPVCTLHKATMQPDGRYKLTVLVDNLP